VSAPSGLDQPGLARLQALVADLAETFTARGYQLYLVGGVVRDLFLGHHAEADDIDLTTDAHPGVIREVLAPVATALWTQGERFGTIGATVNGRQLEITTHRAEAYQPDSRKPMVAFGQTVEEDLARRDFTINAMAVSLPDGELVDPHGGRNDLRDRLLRTPLSPRESFSDDPLRMLRAARFVPRFGLQVDPGVEAAALELADRLAIVSVERVQVELERLLVLEQPGPGVELLRRCGLLEQIVPALADLADGALDTAAALASAPGPVVVRRAGLLAPLGGQRGRQALTRLRYSKTDTSATMDLVSALPVATAPAATAEDVRVVTHRVGVEGVGLLRQLVENLRRLEPAKGTGGTGAGDGAGTFFVRFDDLARSEDLNNFSLPLSSADIMNNLGLEPGPLVGRATAELLRLRLRHGPLTRDEAQHRLATWCRSNAGPMA